jgi:flagellar hook-associated protein 2
VEATVVNVRPVGTADYRIALQSTALGPMNVDIQKTPGVGLQVQQTAGVLASFEINSSGLTIPSSTRSVTVSDGVTLQLLSAGSADVTVTRSTSALSSALSTFATAYNAAVDAVAAHRGPSGGVLQGQSIISTLSRTLGQISTYSSSGAINGLASLGFDLGTDGHLTYNAWNFMGADLANSPGVTSFLGSATGGGFLQAATDSLSNLQNQTTGLLTTAESDLKSQISRFDTLIAARQSQVDDLQTRLQVQMAAADAMISAMEQQYSFISSMFEAQQTASQMYSR